MYNPSSTVLTQGNLRIAYESIRRSKPLTDHPLYSMVLVQQQLAAPYALRNRQHRQYLLEDMLIDELTNTFDQLRGHFHYPKVDPMASYKDSMTDLGMMGKQGNALLIGYAFLYYRYIRAELDLSVEAIAKALSQSERNLRRLSDSAWQHFFLNLLRQEKSAREHADVLRCQQALPNFHLVSLPEQRQATEMMLYYLRQPQVNSLLVHGAIGSGKTSMLYQVSSALIKQQRVDDVTWLDLQPFDDYPKTAKGLAQLILMARYISVQSHQHPLRVLGTHLSYLQPQRLLLVLDNLMGWESAVRDLSRLLSHCTVIAATSGSSLPWFSTNLTSPPLGSDSSITLLEHWQALNADVTDYSEDVVLTLHRIAAGNPKRLYRAYQLLQRLALK